MFLYGFLVIHIEYRKAGKTVKKKRTPKMTGFFQLHRRKLLLACVGPALEV